MELYLKNEASMNQENDLSYWILKNKSKINMKVSQILWPSKWGIDLSDVAVSIIINNQEFIGRGTDINKNIAVIKAFTEACERSLLHHYKIENSSGLAAHTNQKIAKQNAIYELIERDLLLCHFHTQTPFNKLMASTKIPNKINYINSFLKKNNIDLNFYSIGNTKSPFVIICRISGENYKNQFGSILGIGTKDSLEQAVENSFIECFRQFTHLYESKNLLECISIDKFREIKTYSFYDHGKLALNKEYNNLIRKLFNNNEEIKSDSLEKSRVAFREINFNTIKEFSELPLFAFLAHTEKAQNLYTGFNTNYLNLNRLSEFKNRILKIQDLLLIPHPLR